MKHFCNCGGEFFTDKIGVNVIELADFGPYKIWSTDRLKCPNCGNVIYRSGSVPFAEHYQTDFEECLSAVKRNEHLVSLAR